MNWLEFVASLVGSLAWPSLIVAMFLLLRKHLDVLLPLLQRLKYKHIELEFRGRVEDVRADLAELPEVAPVQQQQGIDTIARLAEISPRAAVTEAWRMVETAAIDAAHRLGFTQLRPKQGGVSASAIWLLEHKHDYDRSVGSVLRELRSLRNQAVHAPEFALSKDAVLEYAASAARVASYLDSLNPPPD